MSEKTEELVSDSAVEGHDLHLSRVEWPTVDNFLRSAIMEVNLRFYHLALASICALFFLFRKRVNQALNDGVSLLLHVRLLFYQPWKISSELRTFRQFYAGSIRLKTVPVTESFRQHHIDGLLGTETPPNF